MGLRIQKLVVRVCKAVGVGNRAPTYRALDVLNQRCIIVLKNFHYFVQPVRHEILLLSEALDAVAHLVCDLVVVDLAEAVKFQKFTAFHIAIQEKNQLRVAVVII